jgi:tetratricopeptide (TPR) repeat protein
VIDYQSQISRSMIGLAVKKLELGLIDEATQLYDQAIDILERLVARNPDVAYHHEDLARAYFTLADALRHNAYPDEAAAAYQKAIAEYEHLVGRYPDSVAHRANLAGCLALLGNLQRLGGEIDAAYASCTRALEIYQQLKLADDLALDMQNGIVECLMYVGIAMEESRRRTEAIPAYRAAITICDRLIESGGGEPSQNRPKRGAAPVPPTNSVDASTVAQNGARIRYEDLNGQQVRLLAVRGALLARAGDFRQAAADAKALAAFIESQPDFQHWSTELYNCACALSLAAGAAQRDDSLGANERQEMSQVYASDAIHLLQESLHHGFTDLELLKADPDLDPIRNDSRFAELVRGR